MTKFVRIDDYVVNVDSIVYISFAPASYDEPARAYISVGGGSGVVVMGTSDEILRKLDIVVKS